MAFPNLPVRGKNGWPGKMQAVYLLHGTSLRNARRTMGGLVRYRGDATYSSANSPGCTTFNATAPTAIVDSPPPTHLPINYTQVRLKPPNNEQSRNVLGGLVRYRGDPTHHINAPSAITQNRLQAV